MIRLELWTATVTAAWSLLHSLWLQMASPSQDGSAQIWVILVSFSPQCKLKTMQIDHNFMAVKIGRNHFTVQKWYGITTSTSTTTTTTTVILEMSRSVLIIIIVITITTKTKISKTPRKKCWCHALKIGPE